MSELHPRFGAAGGARDFFDPWVCCGSRMVFRPGDRDRGVQPPRIAGQSGKVNISAFSKNSEGMSAGDGAYKLCIRAQLQWYSDYPAGRVDSRIWLCSCLEDGDPT